jgi:predicted nuclease of restriction endonuclease-like (RecB) superfamily
MADMNELVSLIGETQLYFKQQAQRQVNTNLTLRNWLFGFYISEYELSGADRAEYGVKLYKEITNQLEKQGFRQIRERHLYLCKDFYIAYPDILRSATAKLYIADFQNFTILRSLTAKFIGKENKAVESVDTSSSQIFQSPTGKSKKDIDELINKLSFTHIIELLKADGQLKRSFYEMEAIKNSWSVRELQRAMNSMLFERTGLSTNKQAVLDKHINQERLFPEDVFRNPYMLEFLGLKEEIEYTESDLEQAIINHLQTFLLEMGRGFCFESRQKRITFDNTHYRIDLVFYHRILRCNVLIDLKLGEFTHADAGQMNMYLNYYKENETNEGDNPPIGIILCASKNESLAKYATTGLPQQVFVNKYMLNLPNEEQLREIIVEEQNKIQANG